MFEPTPPLELRRQNARLTTALQVYRTFLAESREREQNLKRENAVQEMMLLSAVEAARRDVQRIEELEEAVSGHERKAASWAEAVDTYMQAREWWKELCYREAERANDLQEKLFECENRQPTYGEVVQALTQAEVEIEQLNEKLYQRNRLVSSLAAQVERLSK